MSNEQETKNETETKNEQETKNESAYDKDDAIKEGGDNVSGQIEGDVKGGVAKRNGLRRQEEGHFRQRVLCLYVLSCKKPGMIT